MTDLDEDKFIVGAYETKSIFKEWGLPGDKSRTSLIQGRPYLHVKAPAICKYCQTVHPQTVTLKVCSFCHRKQEEVING